MASYNGYQNERNKYAKSSNQFRKADSSTKERELDAVWREKLTDWTTFYRRNIHRFIEHYLGVELYLYQIIWIYLMSQNSVFMSICARASAKSYLIALYAIAKCILYPGTNVVIMSATKKQAGLIITEKIQGIFQPKYPNIAREIDKIVSNNTNWEVFFHNGSKIVVVAASDNARGHRSNLNIYEEFRLVKKEIIDKVGTPMLEIRQAPYLKKEEYKNCFYEAEEVFISSGGYKHEWIWSELVKYINGLYQGKSYGVFATDYFTAIKHRIKTFSQIQIDKEKMDETSFSMEYQNLMIGESDSAYFKYKDFKNNSDLELAFYPHKNEEIIKTRQKHKTKEIGEIRLLIADIAMAGGQKNDNTIIQLMSLQPSSKGYIRQLKYIESCNGMNTENQVLRLKQIFNDFQCDYFVLDIANAGRSIYDLLTKKTIDTTRVREDGEIIEYDALKITEDSKYHLVNKDTIDDLKQRTLLANASPVIIPITGTVELNHLVHMEMKKTLNDRKIQLLINPEKAEDMLIKSKRITGETNNDERIDLLKPYLETNEMINESVSLESVWTSGKLKLVEPSGNRKDRYMTLGYGNYFASVLERYLLKQEDNNDMKSIMGLMSNGFKKENTLKNIFR